VNGRDNGIRRHGYTYVLLVESRKECSLTLKYEGIRSWKEETWGCRFRVN
jgi:hypothetical protein